MILDKIFELGHISEGFILIGDVAILCAFISLVVGIYFGIKSFRELKGGKVKNGNSR